MLKADFENKRANFKIVELVSREIHATLKIFRQSARQRGLLACVLDSALAL